LINELTIYPANIFVTSQDTIHQAIKEIQIDLKVQVDYFKEIGKHLEAKRLEDRVNYDIEMIKELGYCSGIENYSRYFDKRKPGTRPFCLIDYFPDDFILIIDESHVSIPQIKGMYEGDRSRKINLVEYGFRLPAALDNRPLRFEEFQSIIGQTIYISATPADFELEMSQGAIVEQVVRPTGLLDPIIEIRPCLNQIDDLLEEINKIVQNKERVLVTTLTKRMAEELSRYLQRIDIKTQYIHSDVDTLERIEILDNLREGAIDVLIGVNLLREGLDLPEVSLVAILDADKEGFLRSERSLTQTAGRAARNVNGKVIFYADKITQSMQKTMDETNRRREKQIAYNLKNNIYPQSIQRTRLSLKGESQQKKYEDNGNKNNQLVAEENHINYLSPKEINNLILSKQKAMEKAVKELDKKIKSGALKEKYPDLEAVFEYPAKETWLTGQHTSNIALSPELKSSTDAYNAKSIEFKYADQLKKIIDLQSSYTAAGSSRDKLAAVDNTASVENGIAIGRVAMVQQGSWIYPSVNSIDPKVAENLGMIPIPLEGVVEDSIPVGVPSYWVVNKDATAEQKAAAKDFLNWLYQSDEGKKIIVDEFNFIPPFTNYGDLKAKDALSQAVQEYSSAGKTIPWVFNGYPNGWSMDVMGTQIQKYLSGKATWDQVIIEVKKQWSELRK